jgi:tricorn protease
MSLRSFAALLLALCLPLSLAAAEPGYYREPTLHGDTLVFTAEGDLWTVPVSGGTARRLTSHVGEEAGAAISPDGRWIGFSASYEGAQEVYAMPLAGGEPKRLSFEGGRALVRGWSPQGELLYASEQSVGPSWYRVLRAVHPETGATRELPLADVDEAAFDAQGRLWFTRFGLALTQDNTRGYRGGAAAQLWRWDGRGEALRMAGDWQAAILRPLPWGEHLILLADAGEGAQLWSMASDGSDRRQLTAHDDFQMRGASLSEGRIVYQHGADLRLFDLASGEDRLIPIRLTSDFEQRRTRWLAEPLSFLTGTDFALNGERVALAGTGALRRIELPLPGEARARAAVLSADGKSVFVIAHAEGEPEIWRYPADGSGAGEQLTRDGDGHRWNLYPSPDGKWLAHEDKRGRLWLLELGSGRNRMIDDGRSAGGSEQYGAVVWSPDSRRLALVRPDSGRLLNQVMLHEVASGRTVALTSDRYESFAPAFSRDGRWLYFLSNRHFQASPSSPWGDRNLGPGFDRRTRVYAIDLVGGQRFPFLPPDELAPPAAAESGPDEGRAKGKSGEGSTALRIAWEGVQGRLFEVPLEPGNYRRLALDDKRLYLIDAGSGEGAKPELKTLAIGNDAPKPETFAPEVRDFALSGDGRKLWFIKHKDNGAGAGDQYIVEAGAKAPAELAKFQVRVGDWRLPVEPVREWRQMYHDAWRLHRDFLFDAGLRGVDWPAMRDRYAALLPRLTERRELDDLLAQLSAELNVLHSQVRGGDVRRDREAAAPAFLGAEFEPVAGGLRLARIYRGDPELPSERGPLARPGLDLREGDVLRAVNGQPVATAADLALRLMQQAGQQVLLSLRRGQAELQAVVQPIAAGDEATLRYGEWVRERRERVEQASDGRIGYLHLRAMGGGDIASFARDFYGQFEREGLIIDVRRNRGGNIDSWVIEKLLRRAWAFWQRPEGKPYWNMQQTFRGHLAVLIDPLTYSDGETFAAGVKSLGLGPLIGQRTAGAGVWLSDRSRLADNGMARVPEFAQYGHDGRWLIEGLGVAPDIEVINPPHASWNGADAQLDAALQNVLQRLQQAPVDQPAPQAFPARPDPARDVR